MPTTQQRGENTEAKRHKRETLHSLIEEQIIHALGTPGELLQMQIRPLWENYFRVNVFVGKDAASARIANSYFLTADADGHILTSTPAITKQY